MRTMNKISIIMLGMFATMAFFVSCEDDKDETQKPSSTPTVPNGGNNTEKPDIKTITIKGVEFKMVKVSSGTFQMGATAEQGSDAMDNEYPIHSVTLSDYYIGQTEVTQELWEVVMGSNPSNFMDSEQSPVEQVSWSDCQEFITKLNKLTGEKFRLPTEAEWEFAAKGGNEGKGYKYSGSNDVNAVAWHKATAEARHIPLQRSKPMNWAYTICAETYGNGVPIGKETIRVRHKPIPKERIQALVGFCEAAVGIIPQETYVYLTAEAMHRIIATAITAYALHFKPFRPLHRPID